MKTMEKQKAETRITMSACIAIKARAREPLGYKYNPPHVLLLFVKNQVNLNYRKEIKVENIMADKEVGNPSKEENPPRAGKNSDEKKVSDCEAKRDGPNIHLRPPKKRISSLPPKKRMMKMEDKGGESASKNSKKE